MAGLENNLLNLGLDAMVQDILAVSLHEEDPGSTGDNEIQGENYSRQTPDFPVAEGGSVSMEGSLTFEVSGGSTVAYVGYWGGGDVWHGSAELATSEEFSGDGQYTLNILTFSAS